MCTGSHEGTEENSSSLGTRYAGGSRHRQAQCISPDIVQTVSLPAVLGLNKKSGTEEICSQEDRLCL